MTVLQIMPKEPDERPDNQPWPTFARLYQKTSSMEEGGTYVYSTDSVNFVGSDEEQARVHIEDPPRPKDSWPTRTATSPV